MLSLALAVPAEAYQRPGNLERVSVATGGAEGNGWNIDVQISADGRFVVFGSSSTNIVPNDTNDMADIFVHDRTSRVTERVSVASNGTQANGASANGVTNFRAAITPGGRYVVFVSEATNLVPGDTNGFNDVFLHDRVTRQTERVSVANGGGQGDKGSSSPSISSDGRFVAFSSAATNLVAGDTNGATDVFVRDRLSQTTQRVSVSSTGAQGTGLNPNSIPPFISGDGRFVAFASNATNLVPEDRNLFADIFVRDRVEGTTQRVSVAFDGSDPNEVSHPGGISEDGRYVAFDSQATNLVPADTNGPGASFGGTDVFVFDRQLDKTERVSVRSDGSEAGAGISDNASISSDGRYVAFESEVDGLVPGDTNGQMDAFIHDRITGALERFSIGESGQQGTGQARDAVVSGGGRYVAFSSSSDNLAAGDANNARDVFVRDRGPDLGIGSLTGTPITSLQGPKVRGSGWASFSGQVLTESSDPAGDGGNGALESGGEITSASLVHRPEAQDLLFRASVAALPDANPTCGKGLGCQTTGLGRPGVVYGLRFTLDGARYEVRGMRFSATAGSPASGHYALYRCLETCVEIAPVGGGIGTAGREARMVIPLVALGAAQGSLTEMQAFTALGEAVTGGVTPLDDVALPATSFSGPVMHLGLAPVGAPYDQVAFTTEITLSDGVFQGTVSLPSGTHRLWARACTGAGCSANSVVVQG